MSSLRDRLVLASGDIVILSGSLWGALFVRHFVVPTTSVYLEHLLVFLPLIVAWLLCFVSVGLYDKRIAIFERRLPPTIAVAQITNFCLAGLFFLIVPLAIAPKTVLALYFVISTTLIIVWRLGVFRYRLNQRGRTQVIVVGTGPDIDAVAKELKTNEHTSMVCIEHAASAEEITVQNPTVVDARAVYEELFERTPLSLTEFNAGWGTSAAASVFDVVKRAIDIILSAFLLILFALMLPFIVIAIRLEGTGPIFITQERIGKGWSRIRVLKLRTMTQNLAASGEWVKEGENRVTRVGAILRKTSIDEMPQLISIFRGHQSLIGPRSDTVGLGERLAEAIPNYKLRYRVTPGISGWAQVNQEYARGQISPQSIEDSRLRLQYDLYYIAHRSLIMDISIILKTLSTLTKRLLP